MGEVTVDIKPVLSLIKYHASGDYEEAKKAAVAIAEELDKNNEYELSQYILAQYDLIPTWVAQ